MTPAEMEAELRDINETVAKMNRERDAERKAARLVATTSMFVGILFAVSATAMIVANLSRPNPMATQLILSSLPLMLLAGALRGRWSRGGA
jgi:hypothetical protein